MFNEQIEFQIKERRTYMGAEMYMMSAEDVCEKLGISKATAYKLIRRLNEELSTAGYLVISGKIPRKYFETKLFGCKEE